MSRYAEGTSVSPEKSQMEISAILRRYGADAFQFGWKGTRAAIGFEAHGRQIRMLLEMPDPNADVFRYTATKQRRTAESQANAYEAEVRRRWRAMVLAVKAKLEAVETGISTFEQEWLAHIVLPDGRTVAESILSQIDQAYKTGMVPRLLPALEAGPGGAS